MNRTGRHHGCGQIFGTYAFRVDALQGRRCVRLILWPAEGGTRLPVEIGAADARELAQMLLAAADHVPPEPGVRRAAEITRRRALAAERAAAKAVARNARRSRREGGQCKATREVYGTIYYCLNDAAHLGAHTFDAKANLAATEGE